MKSEQFTDVKDAQARMLEIDGKIDEYRELYDIVCENLASAMDQIAEGDRCEAALEIERDALARDLEAELCHRRAVEESEQKLAAHVERMTDAACKEGAGPKMRAVIDDEPTTSLARRDAEVARSIHVALCEGADHNNLHKAPTAGRAVDFLLSLARQEVEKREPLRRQTEDDS